MYLSELLRRISEVRVIGFRDCEINDIEYDSRRCKDGCIFAALDGEHHTAFTFVKDALVRGASAILTERANDEEISKNTIICKNARKTMAEIAKILYFDKPSSMLTVAVTGTKGKTSTALCLYDMLISSGIKCLLIGTLGIAFGSRDFIESDNTTPEAPDLYRALRDAYAMGIRVAVIEASSQALAKQRIYGLEVYAAIFTNISEDHIGTSEHSSYEQYYLAKKSLFTSYGAKIAFLNASDFMARHVAATVPRRVFAVCEHLPCKNIFTSRFLYDGDEFTVNGADCNAENASLAVAVAERIFAVPRSVSMRCVSNFRADGRFEAYTLYGKTVIIDYAHNADSVRSLLSCIRERSHGRIIAVFGSVGMRSHCRRAALAGVCEELADASVITSDNPDFEPLTDICEEIYSHFRNKDAARIIEDRASAIAAAVAMAHPGDTVALIGKGHERFQLIEGKRRLFSERAIVIALGGTEC